MTMATVGLEDMAGQVFFPRRRAWCRYWKTWSMRWKIRVVRSRKDYILGSNRQIFQNVAVQDPRQNYDHFIVVGILHGASPREHSTYLWSRTRLTLRPPGRQTRTHADELFTELWRAIPKPNKRSACRNLWISAEMWRLVNERVSTRRDPGQDQQRLRRLGQDIRDSFKEEWQRRVRTAGEAVDSLLTGTPPSHAKLG